MADDLLAGSRWECCPTKPAAAALPAELVASAGCWWPVEIPGTAASALREAHGVDPDGWDYDDLDWWFRTRFAAPTGSYLLRVEGLATIGDVWLNGEHQLHSENMFRSYQELVTCRDGENELVVRCSALGTALGRKARRPRWRTAITNHRNLRLLRTSMIGRTDGWTLTPPIVGPWRGVSIEPLGTNSIISSQVLATCDASGSGGTVKLTLRVSGRPTAAPRMEVAGIEVPVTCEPGDWFSDLHGEVHLDDVERWWPAGLGNQRLYDLSVHLETSTLSLSPIGFRTVEVDTTGGAFSISVNGAPVFCRGATWWPTDPVRPQCDPARTREVLELARAGNMNMVRVCALSVYESQHFWEVCDQLGLLVWQDMMIGPGDPPDDDAFVTEIEAELVENLAWLGGHPSLTVLCGSLEVYEQSAMAGQATAPKCRVLDEVVPTLSADLLPGVPYIPSTPSGGTMPFFVNEGVSHYYGVGMYLREPSDARTSGVRFASECLFMATPSDPATVSHHWGETWSAIHQPGWKKAVHYDPGRGWDMEDLCDFYAAKQLGLDPRALRHSDPSRALDAARVSNAELVTQVFSQWRRSGSVCRGGLMVGLRDQRPGSGWGMVDWGLAPKSTWYAFKRVAAPIAVLITDEGIGGLAVHVVNDTRQPFSGQVRFQMFADGETVVEDVCSPVEIAPHSSRAYSDTELVRGFRDTSYVYRFGPAQHDVVVASLTDSVGTPLGSAFFFPLGLGRPVENELGLRAELCRCEDGSWSLDITSKRLAQWVVPAVSGYLTSDAWFHLAPGACHQVRLQSLGEASSSPAPPALPSGTVTAWNSRYAEPITLREGESPD